MNSPSAVPLSPELLDPESGSMFLRVDDSLERLVVTPRGVPMWFAATCISIPVIVLTAYLGRQALHSGLRPFDIAGLAMAWLVLPTFLAVVWWYNRSEAKRRAFFVLDKLRRTITLPRRSLQIEASQVVEFIEVHAWHVVASSEGSSRERLTELSVVVRADSGKITPYPLVTSLHGRAVHKIGGTLAGFFLVELRVAKASWRDRKKHGPE
jgi:hypothetical protein